MKAKTIRNILCMSIPLMMVACGPAETTTDEPTLSKSEAREQVASGKADISFDFCERFQWYGDGLCDDFCPKPDPDCASNSDQFCGGIAGIQCPDGLTCVNNPTATCDPSLGGADCGGVCVVVEPNTICPQVIGTLPSCGADQVPVGECPANEMCETKTGTGDKCGASIECMTVGSFCPQVVGTPAACPSGTSEVADCASTDKKCEIHRGSGDKCTTFVFCEGEEATDPEGQFCGGIAGIQCPDGFECVANPNSTCDPALGGADCGGMCTAKKEDACASVRCEGGKVCKEENGMATCVEDNPGPCASVRCGNGQVCVETNGMALCVDPDPGPCASVRCGDGKVCKEENGMAKCVENNPCDGLSCGNESICVPQNGAPACVSTVTLCPQVVGTPPSCGAEQIQVAECPENETCETKTGSGDQCGTSIECITVGSFCAQVVGTPAACPANTTPVSDCAASDKKCEMHRGSGDKCTTFLFCAEN